MEDREERQEKVWKIRVSDTKCGDDDDIVVE